MNTDNIYCFEDFKICLHNICFIWLLIKLLSIIPSPTHKNELIYELNNVKNLQTRVLITKRELTLINNR